MSNKYINYEKRTKYSYTSYKSCAANHAHHTNALSKPTQEMIRFNRFLVQLCKENGIDAIEYSNEDREDLYKFNKELTFKLSKAGIEFKELWRSKKKFKFDKDGNVVDAWTGKIVRKRGQNGSD